MQERSSRALTFYIPVSQKRTLRDLARQRGELLTDGLLREALGDLLTKYQGAY